MTVDRQIPNSLPQTANPPPPIVLASRVPHTGPDPTAAISAAPRSQPRDDRATLAGWPRIFPGL